MIEPACLCCAPPIQDLFARGSARQHRRIQALPGAAFRPDTGRHPEPDLILLGGTVRTMDPTRPVAEAIAVKNGRIVSVDRKSVV